MKAPSRSLPCPLPEDAVPFVREFLIELARRVPAGMDPPPALQPQSLRAGADCLEAGRDFLGWIETLSGTMGRRVEELEHVFHALLETLHVMDRRLHRAVQRVRGLLEDELAYSSSVSDVLSELRSGLAHSPGQAAAASVVDHILLTLRAKENRDGAEASALSTNFEAVQRDLSLVRNQVAEAEAHTQRLLDQSLRDQVTGLWNRRAFEGRLMEETERAFRYGSELSVALCEVDDRPELDERFDDRTGDTVLQGLAGRILPLLRRSDFFARWNGEEFAVILPSTGLLRAAVAAEKIRSATCAEPLSTPAGVVPVTLSVGLASLAPGDTAETLLSRAEDALGRAKASGRNRVEPEDRQLRLVAG